ncbi:hypothetical protein [Mesorhizobium sp. Root695]|uniref:hypothetical protein n=1 Tax=Mesorhizobium sp. Root695 TaxID=1736589 RepID=UPI0012E34AC7|nr:hypothetical protein [Mesorhizobium sp. Root695]
MSEEASAGGKKRTIGFRFFSSSLGVSANSFFEHIVMEDGEGAGLSAFEFDILREAFRKSVTELKIAEHHWPEQARELYRAMADGEPDENLIARIISR